MKKKYLYAVLFVTLFLLAGIKPTLAIDIPADTSVGTWNDTTRTYTLTTNVEVPVGSQGLVVTENNLTLDGNGYTVTGPGSNITGPVYSGVNLAGRQYVTIQNVDVKDFATGIALNPSGYCNVINNTISDCQYGIFLSTAGTCTIKGNTVSNNINGIWMQANSINHILNNNTIKNNDIGMYLQNSSNNTLIDNTASNNTIGIHLHNCSGHTLTDNSAEGNTNYGIEISSSYDYTLTENTVSNNGVGIRLWGCNDPIGSGTLTNNTASYNDVGIYLDGSYNNEIYHNNFIDNTPYQATLIGGDDNVFSLDPAIGGNYWSDWTGPDDVEPFGFVDSPYVFTGGQDNLPWTTSDGWVLPDNQPPVADAGPDQNIECACQLGGTKVTLNGSSSNDPDGDPLTYSWTWDGGSATGANPTVTLGCQDEYEIILVVNDGTVDSGPDTVTITVVDTTPPDMSPPGNVTIEAQGPDGVPIDDDEINTFLGSVSAVDNCDPALNITDDAPSVFEPGDTIVTFTTTDASGNTSTCWSTVTIVEATESPEPAEAIEDIILVIKNIDPKDAEKEMEKAVKELNKAIDEFNNDKIDKALNKIAKAVKHLMKAQKKDAGTQGVIVELVDLAKGIAEEAIDDAIAAVEPDNPHVIKAQKHYDKALQNIEEGKYDRAIKKFKNAYKEAMKALGE